MNRRSSRKFYKLLRRYSFWAVLGVSLTWFLYTDFLLRQGRDVSLEAPVHRTHAGRIWLINYAHGPDVFHQNRSFQVKTAVNRGISVVIQYTEHDLDPAFKKQHEKVLSNPKGAGLWLWKPYVILKTLKSVPEGDIVFYLDGGAAVQKDVTFFWEALKDHDIMVHKDCWQQYRLRHLVTKEAIQKVGLDDKCLDFPHVWAGLLVMKNNARTRAFIQRWLNYCEDPQILTGHPRGDSQYPGFYFHHFDQSVLMLCLYQETQKPENKALRVRFGKTVTKYISKQPDYYAWHHRHPKKAHRSLRRKFPRL